MNFLLEENLSRMCLSSLHVIWYSILAQKYSDNSDVFGGKTICHNIPSSITNFITVTGH